MNLLYIFLQIYFNVKILVKFILVDVEVEVIARYFKMPQRTGKRGFPTMSDLVKREEEIRQANHRAEARMTRNSAQAGGLESAKK